MLVRELMTRPALSLAPEASLSHAARLLASSEASDLMIAGADAMLVGVVSEGDLIRAVLPDLDEILAAGGSVNDAFDAFIAKGQRLSGRTIEPYVIGDPLTVHAGDHAAVVAALLIEHQIRRLPVVEDGRLVGTVSRSDIARAVIAADSAT